MTLTVRIPIDDSRSCEALLSDGWREVERLETYYKKCDPSAMDATVYLAAEDEQNDVIAIANEAFYPKDKTAWVKDAFGRDDRLVLVCKHGYEIVGFVVLRVEGDTIVIDLIGALLRRQGAGRALVNAAQSFVPRAWPREYRWIQAGTHVNNLPARKFYESLGFETKHVKRTFHK